ncbi:hypothetical protein [Neolewinella persica]|uniref:hypothetical protein n=1 Tax=Neolewinella persica TaxID=70998 RepID=UPI00037C8907|nr:hypothetical protein [Neolewinella persica]
MYNYQTAKNDRRRRQKARFITALITLMLIAAAAYSFGAFDQLLAPDTLQPVIAGTVNNA